MSRRLHTENKEPDRSIRASAVLPVLGRIMFAFLPLSLLVDPRLQASDSTFPCPDEQSRELMQHLEELQRVYPFDQAQADGYARIIELASGRSMDDLALHGACNALAWKTFRTECSDYGYECPHPGDDIMEWPADINEWVSELKVNVPALKTCPDAYIAKDRKLPTLRFTPAVHSDFVHDRLTGWVRVRVDIDESGRVTGARIESSTSPRLEESALKAVRRFRYQPVVENNRIVAAVNVPATIHFHYWDLAAAAGCSPGH